MTYFFLLIAKGPRGVNYENAGTVTPAPGSTRLGIYRQLREEACADLGCGATQLEVGVFSLEPNELAV